MDFWAQGLTKSHTNLSPLSHQTLFIALNITECSTGPFALAQHSASATQYTSKSLSRVFLQERIWRLKLKTNKTFEHQGSRHIPIKLGCRIAALFLYLALKKRLGYGYDHHCSQQKNCACQDSPVNIFSLAFRKCKLLYNCDYFQHVKQSIAWWLLLSDCMILWQYPVFI